LFFFRIIPFRKYNLGMHMKREGRFQENNFINLEAEMNQDLDQEKEGNYEYL